MDFAMDSTPRVDDSMDAGPGPGPGAGAGAEDGSPRAGRTPVSEFK
jgi:hypothetical protein